MEELALHILDLVQNCVEAKATKVDIKVAENRTDNTLHLIIKDDGRGMDQDQLERVVDPFYTTRTTRKVGLGIPLIKAAAEDAGGWFRLESSPGIGTTITACFSLDHIDRAPLGSMADTLAALLTVNTSIDLEYCHSVGERSFCLSTAELKEICGDDLGHPRIIQWIRSYILEQENSLEESL